ncbi:MAG: DUF3320 domain-containing protein [Candidatus Bathyarchaeota archaeon]|nr:DUF3320 domain-containing protein [Candidatus Bathyarchaeota archaeon]
MMQNSRSSPIQDEYRTQMSRRIEDWKYRLIDLSKRNNLLYSKPSKRGKLTITNPDAETIFNKLVVKQNHLEFWMPTEEKQTEEQPQPNDTAKQAKAPEATQLVCENPNRKEIEKVLKSLHRRSLSDYRERGVRILHAAFGTLVWKDIATSEEIRSPLVMVPIELNRENIRKPFSISVPQVEEEAVLNPALQVKLKNDYKIELPAFPEDPEQSSFTEYLNKIRQAVAEMGWTVETNLEIGLFSFHKLVIYKDLEANSQVIGQHPIIRAVVGIKDTQLVLEDLPEEKEVDKIEKPEESFRVLDADSSQRVAIDYALEGQSFVMQGPPGTGKSQTIANIISECIARGKSVLFVSDKMAALEVVYKRLSDVGLAHFCLELHSSKANKQEVVAELKRCLDEQLVHGKIPSAHEFEKLKRQRDQLNGYVQALHTKQPVLQKSAYEALGELAALQQVPYVAVGLSSPKSLTPQKMQELEELMTTLKNVWQVIDEPEFPWRGYRGNRYNLEIRAELTAQLDQALSSMDMLRIESSGYAQQLGLEAPPTLSRVKWLIELSDLMLESPKPEESWLLNPDVDQLVTQAKAHRETIHWCQATRNTLLQRYEPSFFTIMLNIPAELEKELTEISNLVTPASIIEGDLLSKRENLLKLVRDTPNLASRWSEKAQELADLFGLSAENLTAERVEQLSRLALLCFAENKPDARWFDHTVFEQAQEALRDIQNTYQEYNILRGKLKKSYTDGIYDLDLDEYIKRYNGTYKGFLRGLSSGYRKDQKHLAHLTHDGKVPETVLKDLFEARKVKTLKAEIDEQATEVKEALGHYYKGYDTDFEKVQEALKVTDEAFKLAAVPTIPQSLAEQISFPTIAPQRIRQLGNELGESIEKWSQLVNDLEEVIPAFLPNSNLSINQTPLPRLVQWANETARQLMPLYDLTKEILYSAKDEEPANYAALIEDLKTAESVRRKEAEILNEKEVLQNTFGSRFADLETDWDGILLVLEWTKKTQDFIEVSPMPQEAAEIIAQGPEAVPSREELIKFYQAAPKDLSLIELKFENGTLYPNQKLQDIDLEMLYDRITTLRDRVDDLQILVDFKETKSRFALVGLEEFFDRLVEQHPRGEELIQVFRKGAYQEWINDLYKQDLRLGRFRRENHEGLIEEFRKLDQELIKLASNKVIQSANSRKPQDIIIQATDSEVNTLLKEAAKKRRLMPIRTLLQKIPHILPRIKPCMLMSPISVSQFLDAEMMKFDLVLFDEASQIVPEDAICSIYRGKTVVVAGDNKQLPPTSFFQKTLIDEVDWDEMSDDDVEVFDSILDECLGIGLPVKTLRWHYRSRHEDLIAFSNNHFYDGNLVTFPSAESNHHALGVKLCYVENGIYDRGGNRDNQREAQVVADLVFEHFTQHPNKTLGVVTFSIAQMDAVEEAIEQRLRQEPKFEEFFREDRLEGFFIKNLENVQGDERDVMMFSVGYGKDQQGTITMNFGPLNKPGGERRLNVAVTRAREKTVLVTSIKASDIDTRATRAAGVATLHDYLEYAEKGPEILQATKEQAAKFDAPLEDDVAQEIRRMDFKVERQLGCSEYRIDIAVVDPANPGRYLLGIECDGPTYRSSSSARDRDRLREQVLKRLGWNIHRVWSPAWVARRESEVRRLKEALTKAGEPQKKPKPQTPTQDKTKPDTTRKVEVRKVQFAGIEKIGVPYKVHKLKATVKPYVKVTISKPPYSEKQKNEFHFTENRTQQRRLLAELVKAEGPVHFEYAVQRLASAWGLKRVSPKVTQAVQEALDLLVREKRVLVRDDFLWPVDMVEVDVRVPAVNAPESKRLPEHIPPEEIEKAMKMIAQYSLGIDAEALITETGKVFGFTHGGEKIKEVTQEVYEQMLREKKLVTENGVVTAT